MPQPSWTYRAATYVQVVKAALASAISWWIASSLFPEARPYFAPLAAVLTVQVSVAQSLARGGQRILGVVGGIAVSLLLAHYLGVSGWSVGVLLLVGMAGATALGFAPAAVTQVGISALLILALKATPAYAAARLLDTMIGAVTAILVNAVVIPPDATPLATDEAEGLARRLAEELGRLDRACRGDGSFAQVRGRLGAIGETVERAKARVRLARESLLYSPLLSGRETRLCRVEEIMRQLERIASELRGMARSLELLSQAGEEEILHLLEPMVAALADTVTGYAALIRAAGHVRHGDDDLPSRLERVRRQARQAFSCLPRTRSPLAFREAGSVMADAARMVSDLEASATALDSWGGGAP